MFPFGAVTVSVMSPFLSVVPLTSIVVEPSTPPALSCSPLAAAAEATAATGSDTSDSITLLTESDDEELPPETSMLADRLYFEELPWFAAIV